MSAPPLPPGARLGDAAQIESARAEQPLLAGILDGERAFVGPEHVVVDLTNRCNFRCVACWTFSPLLGAEHKPPKAWYKQQLPDEVLLGLLADLAGLGTQIVRFTGGGEPLMHPAIRPAIARAAELGLRLDITTNASHIDREMAEFLVRCGMGELSVSLWAADEESFAATHPGHGAKEFQQIISTLRYLIGIARGRLEVVLLNVISKRNYTKVEAMYDLAHELGASRCYFTLVDPIEGATEDLLLDAAERESVLAQVQAIEAKRADPAHRAIGIDFWEGFQARLRAAGSADGQYDREAVDKLPCYIGWYFCRVMADGQVAPCCRGVDKPMGDLNEASFAEIWASARYGEFRHKALTLPKTDAYFEPIGCQKMCDNLMHNELLDQRLRAFLERQRYG